MKRIILITVLAVVGGAICLFAKLSERRRRYERY